jgi:spore coat polysaccharide biosynthesis protein SpsF
MTKPKVAILIAVRMKSKRLPGKALLEIEGKKAIEHLFDRLKLSKTAEDIILCTSINPQDDILVEVAKNNGIKFFQGSEDDVLDRFIKAADSVSADIIVRVTGDNILVDPSYLDEMVKYHIQNNADYTRTESLPSGVKCEAMSVLALKKIHRLAEAPENSEYMTWYFTKNPEFFKIAVFPVPKDYVRPNFRLTMDEPNDYELLKIIFRNLYKKDAEPFLWQDIVKFLDENPEFLEINRQVVHRNFDKVEKEINVKLRKE